MAIINFVVPPLSKTKFSGGILCILRYANGLCERGHTVNVIPLAPCDKPEWINNKYTFITKSRDSLLGVIKNYSVYLSSKLISRISANKRIRDIVNNSDLTGGLMWIQQDLSQGVRKALACDVLTNSLPDADFTVATSFETAMPVYFHGKGVLFYFMQHFEPYFCQEYSEPDQAEKEALLSYKLGLNMIANSTWLKNKVEKHSRQGKVDLCLNAIDNNLFYGEPRVRTHADKVINIISYGGRNARWKGFEDMAYAIRELKTTLKEYTIRWQVYGDALLPPDNGIASYESLGFLTQEELAQAYRNAHILLSFSWYESFPLFPLEAMSSGLPVITTEYGVEDYAFHGETAEIAKSRDVRSLVDSLIRVVIDYEYANNIAAAGNKYSKNFNWSKSIHNMERILLG